MCIFEKEQVRNIKALRKNLLISRVMLLWNFGKESYAFIEKPQIIQGKNPHHFYLNLQSKIRLTFYNSVTNWLMTATVSCKY